MDSTVKPEVYSDSELTKNKLPIVAVVAFNQITPFHLSVPCVVFGDKKPHLPTFDLRVCSVEKGPLTTTAGFSLNLDYGIEAIQQADIVIVPSWRNPDERPEEELLDALQQAHARGAQIVGLCLGAYVLAEAGLLDGLSATTHWAYAQDFARRYPQIELNAEVLYIDLGQLITSAGTTAGIDCCLHMLRAQYGAESANSIARLLVMPPHRQGGQAQFIDLPLPATPSDSRLAELIDWVRANLQQPHDLDSLAEKALMSRRTFTRHFKAMTGTTVTQWLLNERLAFCQRLLESTDQSIEQIAELAGFGSPVSLRQQFRKAFGVSPKAWRQTFKGD
ncbi:MAG: AraC family transcriptional regulator [Oceanospirillum sp.]|nr:AraC family transcriptional regulator [Oceanospirillum sp.]